MVLVNLFSCVTCANNSDHVSPRYAVATARSLPLPSGVGQGPDGAAGVDEMEGEVSSDRRMSPCSSRCLLMLPAEKLAFGKCDIFAKKGSSSWHVKCTFCGRTVTTSSHKMIYGHYLQTDAGIQKCLDKERLRELDKDFLFR